MNKNPASGTFVLIGYCGDKTNLQQAFILTITAGLVHTIMTTTRWVEGMPSGLEYRSFPVVVSRNKDSLCLTCKEADVEFIIDAVKNEGKFYTGLASYSSGSSGKLNDQSVKDFVQYLSTHVEL